jgi:hypothetical protein
MAESPIDAVLIRVRWLILVMDARREAQTQHGAIFPPTAPVRMRQEARPGRILAIANATAAASSAARSVTHSARASSSCISGCDVHHWLLAGECLRQVTMSASGERVLRPAMLLGT